MKVKYDFHIHSGLSPCADDNMTPCNIVGFALINGIDMIAVSDHNAIGNVKVAMEVGDYYGVTVVPAMELQTSEDIHILCLFEDFCSLENFYNHIQFFDMDNKPEVFGNQYLFNSDDEVIGTERRLLLNGSLVSSADVKELVESFGGVAIPAHVDRDANGMIAILGAVTEEFTVVELSTRATCEQIEFFSKNRKVLVDSDAHTLDAISNGHYIELNERSCKGLLDYLRK